MARKILVGGSIQKENKTMEHYDNVVKLPTSHTDSPLLSKRQADILARFQIGSSTPDLPLCGNGNGMGPNPFAFEQRLPKVGTEASLAQVSTYTGSLYNGMQRIDGSSTNYVENENIHGGTLNRVIIDKMCKKFSSSKCDKNGDNLAAVLHGAKNLKVENRPVPELKSNQVLLQIEVCGVCSSDVKLYQEGKIGECAIEKPLILGHEASGTVVKCGDCVKNLQPGDKVAIEPQVACRMCALCKAGKYHMCPHLYFCSTPSHDGNLCRLFVHDFDFCHKIPCAIDLETATLIEPLSHAVHACRKGHITGGDSVLILGAGSIGLASTLACKAFGASSVVLVDIDSFRLKKGMEMGADCGINSKDVPEEEVIKNIHEILGHRPNKTLDCCGCEAAIKIGIMATDTCGTMVLVGMGKETQCIPITQSVYKEIDIMGSMRYANDFGTAIDMVATGKVDPKPMITHHFKLEDACKAFELASKKEENYIKIMVHANPKWTPSDDKCKT